MEIVILQQKNYTVLKYLTLLLFIISAGALRCAGMVELEKEKEREAKKIKIEK